MDRILNSIKNINKNELNYVSISCLDILYK